MREIIFYGWIMHEQKRKEEMFGEKNSKIEKIEKEKNIEISQLHAFCTFFFIYLFDGKKKNMKKKLCTNKETHDNFIFNGI